MESYLQAFFLSHELRFILYDSVLHKFFNRGVCKTGASEIHLQDTYNVHPFFHDFLQGYWNLVFLDSSISNIYTAPILMLYG